jgi:DNA-binding response OmpR family regulator/DNA-binding CsgD family transcriptional regulator
MDRTDAGGQPIILIIDDNATNLKVAIAHLEAHGFEVVVARSGESGLGRAQFARPDLILLDVQLPGIDGFETCRRLKADPATATIPVLFMTVRDETPDKVAGFAAGGVDYITKPLQLDEVLARIATHLTIRRLQRQLEQQNESLEQRVQERTAELLSANQALQAEIDQRLRHQQEKDKLFDVAREQGEQLRALTSWLLQSQQDKQHALVATLREQVEQRSRLLESNLRLVYRLLGDSVPGEQGLLIAATLERSQRLLAQLTTDMSAVANDLQQPILGNKNPLLQLSSREREIVQLIGDGQSISQIADLLCVSVSTIYTHRTRILDKLGLTTPAHLVKFAMQHRNFYDVSS